MNMNDIAIEENPCVSADNRIPSDGKYKVAKMSELEKTPKIQTLAARWKKELDKINKVNGNLNENKVSSNNSSIMSNLGATITDYYKKMLSKSARKLRVNPIVINKSKNVYGIKDGIVLEKENNFESEEVNNINDQFDFVNEEIGKEEPVVDTRMSRLERTGEIPTVSDNQTMKRVTPQINDVINTPTRFERHMETPFDALINDNNINTQVEKDINDKAQENRGGDPNLYNQLIHGKENNDISSRLQEAKNRLYTVNEEKEKAKAVNASLEAEVENVRRTIEKIKRDRQEKEEKELSNTLNMLQAAKEEILGETRKYDNLQEELSELLRQRDNLLNNSSYGEDNYSRRRAA